VSGNPTGQPVFALHGTPGSIKANPASHITSLGQEIPEPDRRVVDGWIDDVLAFCSPWGFDLSAIRVPVLLWHGENDIFSPVAHARWLAGQIPGALLQIRPGAAHFGALEVLPDVLSWLVRSS
jgi:pimeloyl-ACP methyl ester carboxylesterase